MGRKGKAGVLGAALVLVVVIAVAIGSVGWVTAAGQPQLTGTVSASGLGADARVSRDANGITQITAATPHDLFFAQGWVHASERLWQMEVWRRAGAGRLAEILGDAALAQDKFIRTLNWRGAAERDYAALSDDTKAALQAYSDGVNAYVNGHPGPLGAAFELIAVQYGLGDAAGGYRPEPWTPVDTLTFAKVEAWGLGGNMDTEIFRMLEDARLGTTAVDELFPAYPPDRPVIASPAQTGSGSASAGASGRTPAVATTPVVTAEDAAAWTEIAKVAGGVGASVGLTASRTMVGMAGIGSNNWVVNGTYTASGKPMLANDPHLGFNMPSIWYVNGLHCAEVSAACPFNVVGVTFPGTPGVVAGHNARISWGVTNVNPDVQDLVMEQADPADPAKYVTASGAQPFTVRTETFRVAGGSDVSITVRETAHGPIINDIDPHLAGSSTLLALRWTATALPDRVLEAFLHVDTASNWNEFRDALRVFGAPSQNFVYADVDGNIGYQMPGVVPVRTDPADHGARPVPGWDGQHEWTSFIPFDNLPSVYNPPSGRIVTANNPVDGGSLFLGAEYDRGDRAARITTLLDAAKGTVTAQTMRAIQGDTTPLRGLRVADALRAMNPTPTTADGRAVLAAILAWDGTCPLASVGCSAFSVLEYTAERAVLDDDLGAWARDYVGSDWANDLLPTLLGTPDGLASAWWGSRQSGRPADAAAVTATALDAAGAMLRHDLGDPASWQWGRFHQITFGEATLGSAGIGPLDWYFNAGPMPVAGANGAPDNVSYSWSGAYPDPADASAPVSTALRDLFSATDGPSMRAIYDMADLDASRIVTTTGQSGVAFSTHNTDFIPKWLANQTVPLPFSPDAIERATAATLVLTPSR